MATEPNGDEFFPPDVGDPVVFCKGCKREIDPDCCGCGDSKRYHGSPMTAGHSFIPLGCTCFYATD